LIFPSLGDTVDKGEFCYGTVATDNNDYLIYDTSKGDLYYESNGNAEFGQTLFAHLNPGTILDFSDFMVV
jgi:hypothetical protein